MRFLESGIRFLQLLAWSVAVLFVVSPTSVIAEITVAKLVADDSECRNSKMIFYSESGFIDAEWFGGLMQEDVVYFADFHSFGMKDDYNQDGEEAGRIWVDNF